ncbi:oxidoreductase, oxygen dependent, FAD-dependent protein [Nitzschia inconspicua]|uniref:Oxidoreductase, oxygen dependent, FAD-dependent protein n=1 Tax=Nitzschia inconspicua TaxID=303405 RepID=A0A9K3LT24_9STRA|nr:oxidoreductase, oxygen dependent, FAD-dependent protein [Nitzschia inconspicua]
MPLTTLPFTFCGLVMTTVTMTMTMKNENLSSDYSLRQAAALLAARRHAERMWIWYFKVSLSFVVFFMIWSQMKPLHPLRRIHPQRSQEAKANPSDTTISLLACDDHVLTSTSLIPDENVLIKINPPIDDEYRKKVLETLKNLDEEIQGDIVLLSNKTKFIGASQVWQQKAHLTPPLAVVEVANPQDVELALPILSGLKRDYHVPFRIRSGGHSYLSDFNTVSDGVMLSLAKLKAMDFSNIDSMMGMTNNMIRNEAQPRGQISAQTITMQPGVTVEEFMKESLYERGFSSIVASAGEVGMGGFILGGGYGLQSRMYGLAIDNVVEMQVVLTNGQTKDVTKGDDLFWALRGAGGGNFGVVTSLGYRVYPSSDIKLEASVKVTLSDVTLFLQRLGAMEPELHPEFNVHVHGYEARKCEISTQRSHAVDGLFEQKDSPIVDRDVGCGLVTVSMYWMGDANPEERLGMTYIKDTIVPLFPSNTTREEVTYYYFSWSGMSRQREQDDRWKSVYSAQCWNGFLLPRNNTYDVWTDIQESMKALFLYTNNASPRIELWGGAISKVSSNTSAFPHRNALYNVAVDLLVPEGSDPKSADDEAILVHAIWPSIARHLDGVYINNAMASLSGFEYPLAYWGSNSYRLRQLKQQYDPFHVLTFSQSIPLVNVSLE